MILPYLFCYSPYGNSDCAQHGITEIGAVTYCSNHFISLLSLTLMPTSVIPGRWWQAVTFVFGDIKTEFVFLSPLINILIMIKVNIGHERWKHSATPEEQSTLETLINELLEPIMLDCMTYNASVNAILTMDKNYMVQHSKQL